MSNIATGLGAPRLPCKGQCRFWESGDGARAPLPPVHGHRCFRNRRRWRSMGPAGALRASNVYPGPAHSLAQSKDLPAPIASRTASHHEVA
eukprot:4317783-Pyramimonas_sp.AAC.1